MKNVLMFIGGTVLGAGIGVLASRKHYSDIYTQKVEEMREHYRQQTIADLAKNKPDISEAKEAEEEYEERLVDEGYREIRTSYSDEEPEEEEKVITMADVDPEYLENKYETITEDELGYEGYETKELTLYSDGILADENDELVDPDTCISGIRFYNFMDGEDDAMFVRNNDNQIDYTVVKDERKYSTKTGIFVNEYTRQYDEE